MTYQTSEHAIGILDSGVGGLTVAKEVMRQLPRETIYYFGDTKRCPYGPRSEREVRQFTFEIVHFLKQFPLKAILMACNTATSAALNEVKEQLDIPILGVIEPGARAAIKASKQNRIGVIGTQGTIQSRAYEKTLKRIHPSLVVHSLACPALVPLVESGYRHSSIAEEVVQEALRPFQEVEIDTLILGCTHYPLLAEPIAAAIGREVAIISSAEETAAELSTILQHKNLLSCKEKLCHRFFTTGLVESFAEIAEDWLGQSFQIEAVELGTGGRVYGVKVF